MLSDVWGMGNNHTVKSVGRLPHQRESSLSSLGSAGPASPYSHNTSNPHIAVTDATDIFHDMPTQEHNCFYQLAKSLPTSHDDVYPNYNGLSTIASDMNGYAPFPSSQKARADRGGLLPAPELSVTGTRSHPASVASSVAGDSPATPSLAEHDDDRRRKAAFSNVPKLDRTMTDIYNDELYSPNFTITSASPVLSQPATSPSNEVFVQRLNAANNQHLSAAQSPVSSDSRDRSPFRQGSPLAPIVAPDFGAGLSVPGLRFNSAHHCREQKKAKHDAQLVGQQMSLKSESETPKTISPKDAMLELHDADVDNSFSLFPSQDSLEFPDTAKAPTSRNLSSTFSRSAFPRGGAFPYLITQSPGGVQVPQQYPFIAQSRPQPQQDSRPGSVESSSGVSDETLHHPQGLSMTKPAGAAADSGTYTCTYHGCTLRFETPALLQKHKREGHRQAQSLGGSGRVDSGVPSPTMLLNSQAGPHRCDRINPSTGKSCNTIFSRPYDLTRHEDTIHNARKQKVRCDLCTEEKTFSRADALTRHYRVCHPDVDFPGKHRRRVHNI
ncbi:Transcriptional regulator RPN4 [Colletotrichum spinosum]|uniref:Transcriptional regulator RPN4 n=1 Tax=Colletotrichum spinosum TaxID=1347390 RepID=A0A4R8PRC4_9PEZI|nr:Transcriptional regulator RPN4 [Colletotrichum spinosum]